MSLKWRGDQVFKDTVKAAEAALATFDLKLEAGAKKELYKGHGVLTGTLRRSLHAAPIDYVWSSDDEEPSPTTPELGGHKPKIVKKGLMLWGAVGSGLVYAMAVHQGHGSFGGYHYIRRPLEAMQAAGVIIDDFKKEMRKRGYR